MHFTSHSLNNYNADDYLQRFDTALRGRLSWRLGHAAQDIAQAEIERVKRRLETIIGRYPNPEVYASVRLQAAIGDYFRRERVQRGEGANARRDQDGVVRNGRTVLSGDSACPWLDDGATLFEANAAVEPDWADTIDIRSRVAEVLRHVSPADAEILYLSFGLEYSDVEISEKLGYARETVNRRKQQAVRRIRGFLGPDTAE